jgi:hypothetical protein
MAVPTESGRRSRQPDARQHLVDRVAILIEKAGRKGSILSVGAETERLIGEYKNCPMSSAELHETIVRLATARRMPFAL